MRNKKKSGLFKGCAVSLTGQGKVRKDDPFLGSQQV
jgi:hypothetical protein